MSTFVMFSLELRRKIRPALPSTIATWHAHECSAIENIRQRGASADAPRHICVLVCASNWLALHRRFLGITEFLLQYWMFQTPNSPRDHRMWISLSAEHLLGHPSNLKRCYKWPGGLYVVFETIFLLLVSSWSYSEFLQLWLLLSYQL